MGSWELRPNFAFELINEIRNADKILLKEHVHRCFKNHIND